MRPPRDPASLTAVGCRLFFAAGDGSRGTGAVEDGRHRAGTVLVKDIYPGEYGDSPSSLVGVGGTLFFAAADGTRGSRVVAVGWHQGGHGPGQGHPSRVRGYEHNGPSSLVGVGGTLFFAAGDGSHGRELWRSDGSRAGTVLVKDIDPDGNGREPYSLTGAGGTLFFTADDGTHGQRLWKSDGTRAGTVLVKDIQPRRRLQLRPLLPDRDEGEVVLHRRRRRPRVRLPTRRHQGGHGPGQGHQRGRLGSGWQPEGQANTSRGTLRLRVDVAGAGQAGLRPALADQWGS